MEKVGTAASSKALGRLKAPRTDLNGATYRP